MWAANSLVAFGLDLDTEVFTEAFEAHIGGVFVVVVLWVGKLRETILGNILGAYDARLARNRDSFSRYWLLVSVLVIVLAFAFDANESGCCGSLNAWIQRGIGI